MSEKNEKAKNFDRRTRAVGVGVMHLVTHTDPTTKEQKKWAEISQNLMKKEDPKYNDGWETIKIFQRHCLPSPKKKVIFIDELIKALQDVKAELVQ